MVKSDLANAVPVILLGEPIHTVPPCPPGRPALVQSAPAKALWTLSWVGESVLRMLSFLLLFAREPREIQQRTCPETSSWGSHRSRC